MNYKKPVIEKLKTKYNIEITTPYLNVLLRKFKDLVNYEFTNVELLIDLEQDILIKEFVEMIIVIKTAKEKINNF